MGNPGVTRKKGTHRPYRGISLIRNSDPLGPPWDPPRTLGIGLLQGPSGWRFLMSEVPCRVVICSWDYPYRRPLGHCVPLLASNPCTPVS